MKGIILAGGSGTRLYPLTKVTSKQLLPVYDKPMIYYPLSTLMLAGIRDILIISTPVDLPNFIIGEEFIAGDPVAMILGDNIFYGNGLSKNLREAAANSEKGASIFGYYVDDPERFGIVEFNDKGEAVSIEEKPAHPKSNYCVTGLYFYDGHASEYAKSLTPSARGELEITDLNRIYLEKGKLSVFKLGRGYAWLDTGTMDSLSDASEFVRVIEKREGIMISAVEEIAYVNGWINRDELLTSAEKYGKSPYGGHLKKVADGKIIY